MYKGAQVQFVSRLVLVLLSPGQPCWGLFLPSKALGLLGNAVFSGQTDYRLQALWKLKFPGLIAPNRLPICIALCIARTRAEVLDLQYVLCHIHSLIPFNLISFINLYSPKSTRSTHGVCFVMQLWKQYKLSKLLVIISQ